MIVLGQFLNQSKTQLSTVMARNASRIEIYLVPTETLGFITIPISLVGVCSSLLCLWFLWKHFKEEKPTITALYVSLSCATLLFCGIVCPIHAHTQLLQEESSFAQKTIAAVSSCRFIGFFYFWTLTSSAYSHSAIAANRLLIVVFSEHYPWVSSIRCVSFLIGFSWFIAAFTFMWPLMSLGGTYGFSTESMKCTFTSLTSLAFVNFYKFMYGFAPVVVMVICYAAVFIRIAVSRSRLLIPSGGTEARKKRRFRAEAKVTRVAFITCLAFVVSYIPSAIFGIVVKTRGAMQGVFGMALVFLMWIGCAVNPLLYIYLSSDLRRRINDYVKRRFPYRLQLVHVNVAPEALNQSSLNRSLTNNTKMKMVANSERNSSVYRVGK